MNPRGTAHGKRQGLARVLSKRGLCSRSQAGQWIREGRVRVDGCVVRDPEHPMSITDAPLVLIDDRPMSAPAPVHVMLNKPRGLVTTADDEHGRDTVYRCFDGADLGWIAPVGRLDKSSEGLLLFSNDPEWAARITDPVTGPNKTYHVHVDGLADGSLLERLVAGVDCGGEWLRASAATLLRAGGKNAWLEIVLEEGRNRQIRRLLAASGLGVLRLVRVSIGTLALGELGKGAWRLLTEDEREGLGAGAGDA